MSFVNPLEAVEFEAFDADGRRCKVLPLGAKVARECSFKLMDLIGKSLHHAAASGSHPLLMDVATAGFVMELAARDPGALEQLHQKFLPNTTVEETPGSDSYVPIAKTEDLFFAGDGMSRWFRWLAFNVELNCGPFFEELRRTMPALRAKYLPTKTQSPSPKSSGPTGSGTAS